VGLTVLAYQRSIEAPFVFDDHSGVINNESIRQLWPPWQALSPPDTATGAGGRPLVNLSLAINYRLGKLEPQGYHWFNVGLHAGSALLLWGILGLAGRWLRGVPDVSWPALASAALWALHPLHTESVACVVQRSELIGGFFVLLAFYSFLRSLDSSARRRWHALAVGATWLGVFGKEFVAVTPLLVVATDAMRGQGGLCSVLRRAPGFYSALFLCWVPLAFLVAGHDQRGGTVGFGLGMTAWEYLLTQCRAIALYVQLSLWPHPLVFDYGTPVVRAPSTVWIQGGLICGAVVTVLFGLYQRRAWALAGWWFFALLAPSSSFVPLTTQTIAEHRMYLPLAGLVSLVVFGAVAAFPRPRLIAVAVGAIAVGLAWVTADRLSVYRTPLALWTETVERAPDNPRAHANLGRARELAGDVAGAIRAYETSLRLRPEDALVHYNLGNALARASRYADAVGHFRHSVRLQPNHASTRNNLGLALATLGDLPAAIDELRAAAALDPQHAGARFNLAQQLVALGRLVEAEPEYRAAIELSPRSARYQLQLATTLVRLRRRDEAAAWFESVLRLEPGNRPAAEQLARIRGTKVSP